MRLIVGGMMGQVLILLHLACFSAVAHAGNDKSSKTRKYNDKKLKRIKSVVGKITKIPYAETLKGQVGLILSNTRVAAQMGANPIVLKKRHEVHSTPDGEVRAELKIQHQKNTTICDSSNNWRDDQTESWEKSNLKVKVGTFVDQISNIIRSHKGSAGSGGGIPAIIRVMLEGFTPKVVSEDAREHSIVRVTKLPGLALTSHRTRIEIRKANEVGGTSNTRLDKTTRAIEVGPWKLKIGTKEFPIGFHLEVKSGKNTERNHDVR